MAKLETGPISKDMDTGNGKMKKGKDVSTSTSFVGTAPTSDIEGTIKKMRYSPSVGNTEPESVLKGLKYKG